MSMTDEKRESELRLPLEAGARDVIDELMASGALDGLMAHRI